MDIRKEYIDRREAEVLLERSAVVSAVVKETPKWWQFWKKERVVKYSFDVVPIRGAQQHRIQNRLADLDETPFHNNEPLALVFSKMITAHYEDIVYCIAVLLSHPRKEPTKWLIDFVKTELSHEQYAQILNIAYRDSDMVPFVNGIILMKGISLNKVNPSA
ncbi:hypothetical protein [Niabella aurantiaca]|uniref:hypothetical protein n=1 Tax=Niabella aurantiaca TaxID=379900 RepID=UPI000378598F|nr:hypothetical protein [Niabella aurantiaca]